MVVHYMRVFIYIGNLAEMMTDYDKAMNCYESALRHNPYSVVALSQIASLCRGREQFGRVKCVCVHVYICVHIYYLFRP